MPGGQYRRRLNIITQPLRLLYGALECSEPGARDVTSASRTSLLHFFCLEVVQEVSKGAIREITCPLYYPSQGRRHASSEHFPSFFPLITFALSCHPRHTAPPILLPGLVIRHRHPPLHPSAPRAPLIHHAGAALHKGVIFSSPRAYIFCGSI